MFFLSFWLLPVNVLRSGAVVRYLLGTPSTTAVVTSFTSYFRKKRKEGNKGDNPADPVLFLSHKSPILALPDRFFFSNTSISYFYDK